MVAHFPASVCLRCSRVLCARGSFVHGVLRIFLLLLSWIFKAPVPGFMFNVLTPIDGFAEEVLAVIGIPIFCQNYKVVTYSIFGETEAGGFISTALLILSDSPDVRDGVSAYQEIYAMARQILTDGDGVIFNLPEYI